MRRETKRNRKPETPDRSFGRVCVFGKAFVLTFSHAPGNDDVYEEMNLLK